MLGPLDLKTAIIVPTGVGVNRHGGVRLVKAGHRPHRRGGEPTYTALVAATALIVPTGVGVNRP